MNFSYNCRLEGPLEGRKAGYCKKDSKEICMGIEKIPTENQTDANQQ